MNERAETQLTQEQARQQAAQRGQWRRLPLVENPRLRWGLVIGAVVYLVLALASVEVNWARVAEGAGRAVNFLGAFMQPDFVSRYDDIVAGLLESLTMTLTSRGLRGGAQYFTVTDLLYMSRDYCRFAHLSRDHHRDSVCGHVWLWAAGGDDHPGLCDDWLYGQAVGGRY